LSAVFDNPQAYLGRTFCGSVTVITDETALKVFPTGQVPQDRTGTVGFFDIDTSRRIRSLMRERNQRQRFYVEAKIEGLPQCYRSGSTCVPYDRPIWLNTNSFRQEK
jgi:hypothetical protein